jgi:hypothetical protein
MHLARPEQRHIPWTFDNTTEDEQTCKDSVDPSSMRRRTTERRVLRGIETKNSFDFRIPRTTQTIKLFNSTKTNAFWELLKDTKIIFGETVRNNHYLMGCTQSFLFVSFEGPRP